MQAWQATVQDDRGNAVPNPVVTVYLVNGTTLATIYNSAGAVIPNPTTGGVDGFVKFFANPGRYKISNGSNVWDVDIGAIEAAENAATVAGNALSAANAAGVTAASAVTTANGAVTTANSAVTSAGTANATANSALALANTTSGRVDDLAGKPYVIFAFGQSNMRGFADSIGGDQTSDSKVFFWDAPIRAFRCAFE